MDVRIFISPHILRLVFWLIHFNLDVADFKIYVLQIHFQISVMFTLIILVTLTHRMS